MELRTKTIELGIRVYDYFTLLLSEGYYFDPISKTVQQGKDTYNLLDHK